MAITKILARKGRLDVGRLLPSSTMQTLQWNPASARLSTPACII